MDPGDFAFVVRAVNTQMREHFAPAYLEEPWPVRSHLSLQGMASGTFWPIAILDTIGMSGALGYHDFTAGLSYGRCLVSVPNDGTTLSHEALELRADPRCDLWLPMPDGRHIAREVCDPCQGDVYVVEVEIGDETRSIWVSDFVLPAYFVPGAPPPYTYLDSIDEPFGVSRNGGGWRLIRDASGRVTSDFGAGTPNLRAMAARAIDPLSRTHRRGYRG